MLQLHLQLTEIIYTLGEIISSIFDNKKIINGIDKNNDVFRYADNSEKIMVDFDAFDKISQKDIKSVESDISFLRRLFFKKRNKIDFIPSISKRGTKK